MAYHLRGVAIGPNVMYLCQRREQILIELDQESKPAEGWWKLAFVQGDPVPLKVEVRQVDMILYLTGADH